jgi:hypothetical protein
VSTQSVEDRNTNTPFGEYASSLGQNNSDASTSTDKDNYDLGREVLETQQKV